MIHLSIFMYEVHGAKKEKKVTFFSFFAVFWNKRIVKVHTILPRWNILGSMKTSFLLQCNGGISRLDQQTVRRLLRPPTQDVSGQETVGRAGFLASFLPFFIQSKPIRRRTDTWQAGAQLPPRRAKPTPHPSPAQQQKAVIKSQHMKLCDHIHYLWCEFLTAGPQRKPTTLVALKMAEIRERC